MKCSFIKDVNLCLLAYKKANTHVIEKRLVTKRMFIVGYTPKLYQQSSFSGKVI